MSLFNVVKMVKSGELKSETVTEEGREVIYILVDDPEEISPEEQIKEGSSSYDGDIMHQELLSLQKEVMMLKKEVENLKISIGLKE